jgi:hypothetical protein
MLADAYNHIEVGRYVDDTWRLELARQCAGDSRFVLGGLCGGATACSRPSATPVEALPLGMTVTLASNAARPGIRDTPCSISGAAAPEEALEAQGVAAILDVPAIRRDLAFDETPGRQRRPAPAAGTVVGSAARCSPGAVCVPRSRGKVPLLFSGTVCSHI